MPLAKTTTRLDSQQQQHKNPITLRLYKVLGTNYSDDATREALQTLSDLYYTPTQPSGQREKDADEEDDMEHAGGQFSRTKVPRTDDSFRESVVGESAAKARKHLRRDMENKLAQGSREFVTLFAQVDQKLDVLQKQMQSMRQQCDEAESRIKLTSAESAALLDRASTLRDQRQEVETRKSIITLFLARFTLSESEVAALTSRDVPIGQRFFDAMDRTERIRSDCRVLMAGEDGPTQAGLDIMTSTSSQLEVGYEKLLRWCSFELREIGREVHVEVEPTVKEAVRRLRRRPELASEALGTLVKTRDGTLNNAFLAALTRGPPRPIELHAHDPLRYVGDMLAWVHQTIAAEREFLEALFGLKEDGRMVGSVRTFMGTAEEEEWIAELMDGAVVGICAPLKARVQQTIRSQESSIVAYKIANLLQFYGLTMQRTIGENAVLSKVIQGLMDIAYKVFVDAIEAQGRAILRVSLDLDESDVAPPLAILDHAQILREIMAVYASSLGDEPSLRPDADVDQTAFERVLDVMIDPALEMCDAAALEKKRLRPGWDREVFGLNCLTYLQGMLEPFEFTDSKREAIETLLDQRIEELTEQHYENIRKDAGLETVVLACENRPKDEVLSRNPATEPAQLRVSLRAFSRWLSGADVVHSPRLARLTVQRLHERIHQAALEQLVRGYQIVCTEVRRPENRYEAGSTLLGSERPFGQVHLLTQIFGLKEVRVE